VADRQVKTVEGHAERTKRLRLCDGNVLAITRTPLQGFVHRCPFVAGSIRVDPIGDAVVDRCVDQARLLIAPKRPGRLRDVAEPG